MYFVFKILARNTEPSLNGITPHTGVLLSSAFFDCSIGGKVSAPTIAATAATTASGAGPEGATGTSLEASNDSGDMFNDGETFVCTSCTLPPFCPVDVRVVEIVVWLGGSEVTPCDECSPLAWASITLL